MRFIVVDIPISVGWVKRSKDEEEMQKVRRCKVRAVRMKDYGADFLRGEIMMRIMYEVMK